MSVVTDVFGELVGQRTAKKMLSACLESGNLPQALIFAGQKGVGRKTAAKGVERYLHSQGSHPSPRLRNDLRSFSVNSEDLRNHPDTFWFSQILDEVSKGETREWIDAVREMIRKLTMSPFASKYKLAIIDDADGLSDEAQNALLKTLEEPRQDSIIILIVPNEETLLPTIVSRTQVVRFGPLTDEEIKQIVPTASDEQIAASGGSAGKVKDWVEMPVRWEDEKAIRLFWRNVRTANVKTKFEWAGKYKERGEAIDFIRTGMLVWEEMLPDERVARGLARMQMTVQQIRDNVNLRGAVDTLLLAL